MPGFELKTARQIEDFAIGCSFFGAGGGGDPVQGAAALKEVLDKGVPVRVTGFDEIRDDHTVASIFLMGSIGAPGEEVKKKQKRTKVGAHPLSNKESLGMALDALEEYTGKRVDALFAIELGGGNTCCPMAAVLERGRLFVDADAAGRSYPEMPQALNAILGRPCLPVAIVNNYGDTNILTKCVNYYMIERNGKMLADSGFGMASHACDLMSGREIRGALVPGTLSKAFQVGTAMREARERGEDPIAAALEIAGGYYLASGRVARKDSETIDGLYYGDMYIDGIGEYVANRYHIWFENENYVLWKNDEPWITGPDIIEVVRLGDGMPMFNGSIAAGDEVAILGIPASPQLSSSPAFDMHNPRYFGFDIDHVPIRQVLGK